MKERVFSGHQPNFLPYMGVFYKIFKSDEFVWDDDVQFTTSEYKNDGVRVGHNANAIRVADYKSQILVPVKMKFGDRINEVRICRERNWEDKMLRTLSMNYGKCPHFREGFELLEKAFSMRFEMLSDLNLFLLSEICEKFGFDAKIHISSKEMPTELSKNERNAFQCERLGCSVYYSGTGGKGYNDEALFAGKGIRIEYSDFVPEPYRQYRKKWFMPNLSVIDYIFNNGYEIPSGWSK